MIPQTVARINELARKQRETGLSDEEKSEQNQLRRIYIDNIKSQVRQQLEQAQPEHKHNCGCGCHHKH
ncbi:MAG: hypothetical protein K0Q75_490 [Anaerospora sp.]|jgi:uncharacterized protein YnzC (UPF0291/DUF896 family)|nr:hypothetical protein [Anaerospora sp.]